MNDAEVRTDAGEPKAKWAKNHDRCVQCGRDDIKHVDCGLCCICFRARQRKRFPLKYGNITQKYLMEEYVKNKRSTLDIAKELGFSRTHVCKALKELAISARNRSDARELALRAGKLKFRRVSDSGEECFTVLGKMDVNIRFFSTWSPKMAYVLGVIYSDGCIIPGSTREPTSRSGPVSRLSISQKEPELLQKVLNLMECNARLTYRKEYRSGSNVAGALYSFSIPNEDIYDDLLIRGVTPRKSLTITFPRIPSRELVRHFIRGCWDGDGTVYVPRDGNKARASAGIGSGSLEFMKGIVEHLYRAGIKRRSDNNPLKIYVQRNYYYVGIRGRENLSALYYYLYNWVDCTMRLKRKYEKFLEIMRLYDEPL